MTDRTCSACGGELHELLDGFDACRRCGVELNEGRLLADLLDDVERFYRRFVVYTSDAQSAAVTLHTGHAHAIEAADTTGYLHVNSPEKRSGKTRCLEVQELLVPMPIRSSTISPAALFRLLDSERRTLLLDEVDSIFSPKADREELRGLLNAGYRRGSMAYRIEMNGKTMTPRAFDAFGAKILAGIGRLPDTIADRCIPIELRRRRRDEPIEQFRYREVQAEAEDLRRRLEEWVRLPGTIASLRAARPELPYLEDDRALEAWEPLAAIADMAGGRWPKRAREAIVRLHGDRRSDAGTGVATLAAIRELFGDRDRMSTDEILRGLVERTDGPWSWWWADELERAHRDDRPALKAARGLRRELESYGLAPTDIRLPDGTIRKGYYREAFEDAWSRYLSVPTATSATTATPLASTVADVAVVADMPQTEATAEFVMPFPEGDGTPEESEADEEVLRMLSRPEELRGDLQTRRDRFDQNLFVVARSLAEDGIRCPDGYAWTAMKVQRVLDGNYWWEAR